MCGIWSLGTIRGQIAAAYLIKNDQGEKCKLPRGMSLDVVNFNSDPLRESDGGRMEFYKYVTRGSYSVPGNGDGLVSRFA